MKTIRIQISEPERQELFLLVKNLEIIAANERWQFCIVPTGNVPGKLRIC